MEDPELIRVLVAVGRKVQSALRRHLPPELTLTQAWIMGLLAEHGSLSLSDVATHLDISLSAASVAVDQLIHMGWAEKARSPADRRLVFITLTNAGQTVIADAQQRRRDIMGTLFAHMDPKDVQTLHESLVKVEAALTRSFGSTGHKGTREPRGEQVGP